MDDRLPPSVTALLFAVGVPVAGLAIIVGCTALRAFGPDVLVGNWVGRLLLGLLGFFGGYGLILFSQLRYWNLLVFFGAFFALSIGAFQIEDSVEDWVLHQRGEVTTCTVVEIAPREIRRTDSEGRTSTDIVYDHSLACADPRVQEMTTGSRVSEAGDQLEVAHDPQGRLSPRPAASVSDPAGKLRHGAFVFAVGILLRLLSELGVWPFRGVDSFGGPPGWSSFGRRRRWRFRSPIT
jgi:hypothetical protein